MEDERVMELIAGYLAGSLNNAEKEEWNIKVAQGLINPEEVESFAAMYQLMGNMPIPEPSAALSHGFYTLLEKEKAQAVKPVKGLSFWERIHTLIQTEISVRQLALAAFLLLMGIAIGFWMSPADRYQQQLSALSTEVRKTRELMMLTLLEQPSATERLKAVNLTNEFNQATDLVTHALLKTLNSDGNVNVRLAALDALLKYADNAAVREGLVNAIAHQESPLVQLALAEAMEKLQEKKSVNQLEELLKKEDLNEAVKKQVQQTIQTLI